MEDGTIIKLLENQQKSFQKSLDNQQENLKTFILTSGSLNRAKFINIIDPIADDVAHIKNESLPKISNDNDIRNHRITKLERQTCVTRWAHRNPGRFGAIAAGLLLVMIIGVSFLAVRIDTMETIRGAIEKVTPIEFK